MLLISVTNFDAYGQELEPHKCGNGKWGFVDKETGIVVISCMYDEAGKFYKYRTGDVAFVKLNNKWGYIDKTGKEKVTIKYTMNEVYSIVKSPSKREKAEKERADMERAEREEKMRAETKKVIAERTALEKAERERRTALEKAEREKKANSFEIFAKNYVGAKLEIWEKRGNTETYDQWEQRIDSQESTITAEFYKEAERAFIDERSQNFLSRNTTLGNYNSTNKAFLIKTEMHGDYYLPVPDRETQDFQKNWNSSISKRPHFEISDDRLALAGITFRAADGTSQRFNFDPAVKITISEENLAILQRNHNNLYAETPKTETPKQTPKTEPQKETSQPVVTPQPSGSYDIILLKNGQEIKAKVDEITLSEIKYKSFDNIYGPTRNVAKNNAVAIIYANGQREVISSETTTEKSTTDNKMNNQGDFGIGVSGVAGAGGITLYGICGAVRYSVNDLLRMEGSFTYYPTKTYKSWGIEQEFKVWSISLNSQPILPPLNGENFLLYPLVGIGIIGVKETQRDWLRSEVYDIVYFGFNTGVGFDLRLLKNLFFNLEGKYTKCLTKDNDRYWFMGSAGLVIKF